MELTVTQKATEGKFWYLLNSLMPNFYSCQAIARRAPCSLMPWKNYLHKSEWETTILKSLTTSYKQHPPKLSNVQIECFSNFCYISGAGFWCREMGGMGSRRKKWIVLLYDIPKFKKFPSSNADENQKLIWNQLSMLLWGEKGRKALNLALFFSHFQLPLGLLITPTWRNARQKNLAKLKGTVPLKSAKPKGRRRNGRHHF